NEKKLELPSEFFELLGDAEGKKARMYRCLFEGCKMKFKKDGTQKPLIVFNDTRFNAKRHYLSHDPNNSLGHKEKWRKAVDTLKESSDTHHITTRPSVQRISSQTHLDNWVMIKRCYFITPRLRFYDARRRRRISCALLPETVTLPVHRRCACHLLSIVSKVDVQKNQDFTFQQLRMSAMEKLQKIWNKQNSSLLNSNTIFRHFGRLLVLKNDTRWNSKYSAICSFVRFLRKKNRGMKKLFEEFGINRITPNEEQYLKEFV
ncbi:Uncharacterized protein APZ42_008467, partial [Daphnia magna]